MQEKRALWPYANEIGPGKGVHPQKSVIAVANDNDWLYNKGINQQGDISYGIFCQDRLKYERIAKRRGKSGPSLPLRG